ncbi:MAG TPA: IPT/TIG domain-containing protein [Candidatus Angelobacter sp.]|nr:IPT/TIG domain-containing protein [Candidatus Angelobacter sp.]
MTKHFAPQPALMGRLAAFALAVSCFCFSSTSFGQGVDPAPAPGFTGVSLRVLNSLIPPGGTFQYQLLLTEPKPIGHGSTTTSGTGTVSGIALNDPIGQTAGVAILNGPGIRINFSSPLATFGTNPRIDYPILAIRMLIPANTPVGLQVPLSIDLANSFWFDANGQPYLQEIFPGKLTIGGNLAISDVVPGGGLQPAGTVVAILGMGFRPDSIVSIEGTELGIANTQFISASEIDATLPQAVQMEGARVRVKNPDQTATFFSYFHGPAVGQSAHPLLAQTYPLFARQTYTAAALPWNRAGSQFTGLALQNQGSAAANITLETHSATGALLGSVMVSLPGGSKINRDLLEFFPGASASAVSVSIKSDAPVQMLGLLGDDATGDVVPLMVTAQ